MMDYNIKIQEFEGPMDLLLHLITKNEIDIFDIPIYKITEQYIEYINQFKEYNMDLSSEFILMSAELIHIKSKMLLPPEENDEGEEIDPREELAQKIYEYKIYKEISIFLKGKEEDYLKVYYKDPEYITSNYTQITQINISQLSKAFKHVLSLNNLSKDSDIKLHKIHRDIIRLEDKINEIIEKLEIESNINFYDLFSYLSTKQHIIVTFLAVLELIKHNTIGVKQKDTCGDILIYKL